MEHWPAELLLLVFHHLVPPTLVHSQGADGWASLRALAAAAGVCWRWRSLASDDAVWRCMHAAVFGGPLLPAWLATAATAADLAEPDPLQLSPVALARGAADDRARARPVEHINLPRGPLGRVLVDQARQVLGKTGRAVLLSASPAHRLTWHQVTLAKAKDLQACLHLLSDTATPPSHASPSSSSPSASSQVEDDDGDVDGLRTQRLPPSQRSIRAREAKKKQMNKKKAKDEKRRREAASLYGQPQRAILLGCEALLARLVGFCQRTARPDSTLAVTLLRDGFRDRRALLWSCAVPSTSMLIELSEFESEPWAADQAWPHQVAMLAAAERGDLATMKLLLEQGKRVKQYTKLAPRWSFTLAGSCLYRTRERSVMELVWRLAGDAASDWRSYWHQAAYTGNLVALEFFLSTTQQDLEPPIMEELLGWAVRGAQEQVAALLLDLGAPLNSRNAEGLTTAIQQPHFSPALITLLIDKGQLELVRYSWELFTRGPVARGDEAFCRFLVAHGADIDTFGWAGDNLLLTPLQLAVTNKNVTHARCLLQCGASTKRCHSTSRPALSLAKRKGLTELVDLLVLARPTKEPTHRKCMN